jgi:hypothetical protein
MSNTAARLAKIHEEITDTITENGFEIPAEPGRYLVIMRTMGDRIWAISCETLEECATSINEDDTDREEAFIIDLDTDGELCPILEVVKIMGAEGGDWTRPAPPAPRQVVEITGGCGYTEDNVLIVDYDDIAATETDEDLPTDTRAWLEANNPDSLPSHREKPFTCQGCGREESICSADPCPGVIADRES